MVRLGQTSPGKSKLFLQVLVIPTTPGNSHKSWQVQVIPTSPNRSNNFRLFPTVPNWSWEVLIIPRNSCCYWQFPLVLTSLGNSHKSRQVQFIPTCSSNSHKSLQFPLIPTNSHKSWRLPLMGLGTCNSPESLCILVIHKAVRPHCSSAVVEKPLREQFICPYTLQDTQRRETQ